MKTILLIISLMITATAFGAKVKSRKISNSSYFVCNIERESTDKKMFKKEYHFPFPTEEGEVYELKGSMRWNDFKIIFSQSGEVQISISEHINGERVKATKTHKMGKEPQFDSFRVPVELKKDDVVIPYIVVCSPE